MDTLTIPPDSVVAGTLITDGSRIDDAVVAVTDGTITYAGPSREAPRTAGWPGAAVVPDDAVILPGLVDLHCHGGAGGDFGSGDVDQARAAAAFHRRSGTTTQLASLVTDGGDSMVEKTKVLVELAAADEIAGIHWEGPFLSPQRPGAQDTTYITAPDLDLVGRLVDAAAGFGATMTFAPELSGVEALISQLTMSDVVPSVGHTDAGYNDAGAALAQAAADLGGSSGMLDQRPTVTHLFNGMRPMHHRDAGTVAAALQAAGDGDAVIELIADGVHLAPEMVRLVFSLVGAPNIALVTDAMAAAGCADGSYRLGPVDVVVTDGVARLAGGDSIAGGTSTLLDVVRTTVAGGVPLPEAVLSATLAPAEVLGSADTIGSLRTGHQADLVVCDGALALHQVMKRGEWLL
ncbi:N-acetylglucosamine-6-phosphate deacetylase [Spelaeicoccus albus]|uniref:N-acetylglucosamine-6-phosphate deacetylase n=1 Tax=Spelaeicoccus albus TaxID=1280376 RepID=A0A7Z0D519_9MICO|nr:amidohydrolase family protein [Spelaeicoccus albus]NYI68963.1 N-acetylglucosamine-6-phosphate deacetylase [Spelaeicoccus albus]